MTDDVQLRIGAAVRAAMQERGVSQRELGEALGGVDQASISRRLSGRIPFSGAELVVAADFLGVPTTRLLGDRFPWDQASDNVLANEAALDPEDHSPAAEYVREVAGSVRDHRSVRAGSK